MTPASLVAAGPSARPGVGGAVRLRPAPPLEPPFDDEVDRFAAPAGPVAEGQLALEWRRESPAGRSGGRGGTGPGGAGRGDAGPDRAGRARAAASPGTPVGGPAGAAPAGHAPPPEHRVAANRFLNVGLEILNGYRPAAQLRPFCSPADAGGVVERFAARAAMLVGGRRGGGTRSPAGPGAVAGRCGSGPPGKRAARVRLRSLRVCQPRFDVAEAAAVLEAGNRCWALAFRLEHRRGTWLCTAVAMP
jgi:hypothetical protein